MKADGNYALLQSFRSLNNMLSVRFFCSYFHVGLFAFQRISFVESIKMKLIFLEKSQQELQIWKSSKRKRKKKSWKNFEYPFLVLLTRQSYTALYKSESLAPGCFWHLRLFSLLLAVYLRYFGGLFSPVAFARSVCLDRLFYCEILRHLFMNYTDRPAEIRWT